MRLAEKGLVRTTSPAATDPVTGLPDEQYFWLRLREEHRRVRRYGSQASLAIIDVNNLASVNQRTVKRAATRCCDISPTYWRRRSVPPTLRPD